MSRGFVAILALVILGLGLFYLLSPATLSPGLPGRMLQAANNIRQLSLAIYIYNQNFHEGSMPSYKNPYPDKLTDLIQPDLLTEEDFMTLTKGLDISYTKPTSDKTAPDFVVLTTQSYGYKIMGFSSGEMRYLKEK